MSLLDLPCKISENLQALRRLKFNKITRKDKQETPQMCGHFTSTQLTRSAIFTIMHSGPLAEIVDLRKAGTKKHDSCGSND